MAATRKTADAAPEEVAAHAALPPEPDAGLASAADAGGGDAGALIPGPDAHADTPFAFVAHKPLHVGDPAASGAMPVRAYNPGDLVPAADVERFGWHDQVHHPDEAPPEPPAWEADDQWRPPPAGWQVTG